MTIWYFLNKSKPYQQVALEITAQGQRVLLFSFFVQRGMGKPGQKTGNSTQADGDKHVFRQTKDGTEGTYGTAYENASYNTISNAHARPHN